LSEFGAKNIRIPHASLSNFAHHIREFCANSTHFFKPIFHFEKLSAANSAHVGQQFCARRIAEF